MEREANASDVEEIAFDRRSFLGSLPGGMSVLAGGIAPPAKNDTTRDVDWPKVTAPELDDWTQIDKRKETHTARGITAHERTRIYENAELRRTVAAKTLDKFDSPLAIFFASHIDIRGLTTILLTPELIAKSLRPIFVSQLEKHNIENVRQIRPREPLPKPIARTAVYEYQGSYPTPKVQRQIKIPNVGNRKISIPSGTFSISGLLVVWKVKSGHALAAGGAFPAEDYEKTEVLSVTGEMDDGIDVKLSLDLNLKPTERRNEMITLSESVRI